MEFLIVAAIASLNLSLVVQVDRAAVDPVDRRLCLDRGMPGLISDADCCRRTYWFELGIINYGMSTGVTASGLMLLRIIDEDFDSGAAEDYALAAPLSSPFVGGGLVTVVVIPTMLQRMGVGATAIIALILTAALYWLGLLMARGKSEPRPNASSVRVVAVRLHASQARLLDRFERSLKINPSCGDRRERVARADWRYNDPRDTTMKLSDNDLRSQPGDNRIIRRRTSN